MSTPVRIAIFEDLPPMRWPKACASCCSKEDVAGAKVRVGRIKSARPNLLGGWTIKSDVLYLTVPVCARHRMVNQLAHVLLEKSPLMLLIRGFSYMLGLGGALILLASLIRMDGAGLVKTYQDSPPFFWMFMGGLVASVLFFWLKRQVGVRVVRLDPDLDVLDLRFRDPRFAKAFKKANPEATDSVMTAGPPWYRRKLTHQLLVLAVFFAFMAYLFNRQ